MNCLVSKVGVSTGIYGQVRGWEGSASQKVLSSLAKNNLQGLLVLEMRNIYDPNDKIS